MKIYGAGSRRDKEDSAQDIGVFFQDGAADRLHDKHLKLNECADHNGVDLHLFVVYVIQE